MIKVENVSKKFPGRLAVDHISFEVARGEILGFLGSNGAGKTTTMRMMTGYLPMDSGSIKVAGFDVSEEPQEVRRRIGYLPESCPLYPEMRVDEYLRFRAELKGVKASARKTKLGEVKEQCGLTEVGKRIVGQLSKGYRQRVGLADSLIHDPELLILDEPTVGLDPFQICQVRELIKQLSERHTIVLCTHILPEVEAICERILILNEGKIAAVDTGENLQRQLHSNTTIVMEVYGNSSEIETKVAAQKGVKVQATKHLDDGWLWLEVLAASPELRVELFNLAATQGWGLRELTEQNYSLEDTFVKITQNQGTSL